MGTRSRTWVVLSFVLTASGGCASGGGDSDSGPGPGVDASRPDAGTRDAGDGDDDAGDAGDAGPVVDGGDEFCGEVVCEGFQYCDGGLCRDYPPCSGAGTCPRPLDVCHNRLCVPGHIDVDGDGSPASEDCDETNPDRFPGNPEICSPIDEDCDDVVDEGDPATLCEFYPGGGICVDSSCGCPPGTFDIDRSVPGCECVAMPPIDQALSCTSAIDLGDLADVGQMITQSGNVMPDDREVWYRFRGVDNPDAACDNFHVRVQFVTNPSDTFELTVFRGSCDTVECADGGFTDYSWATDFRATLAGMLTGQCPCFASGGAPTADVSICEDDGAQFFVRVRRRAGAALSCETYTIELSNGVYDTP
jgi:hypothetical protein